MAFDVGNKFWLLRSQHGRKKLFETPELLWQAACEYFEWCQENPLIEVDFRGKDATEVNLPKMRAFTYEGLTLYFDVNVQYFNDFEAGLRGKKDKLSIEFSAVITRIRQIVQSQQFTGAASGFLKENIIARYLGLKDNADITTDNKSLNVGDIDVNDKTKLLQEVERISSLLGVGKIPVLNQSQRPKARSKPKARPKKSTPKIIVDKSVMPESKVLKKIKADKLKEKAKIKAAARAKANDKRRALSATKKQKPSGQ